MSSRKEKEGGELDTWMRFLSEESAKLISTEPEEETVTSDFSEGGDLLKTGLPLFLTWSCRRKQIAASNDC